nr:CRISPR-associated endonuclease Cas1 [Candidatus Njordarchaeum guaymaensis]
MNLLHLSGYGVKLRVRNLRSRSDLDVTDGRGDYGEVPSHYTFRPRRIPYDSIIIDGHSGYVSLQAFHWLSRNKVPVFILNFDGSLISSILPPMPVKADLRSAQLEAYKDPQKKDRIAYELVKAKIQRTNDVLRWLGERYDIERQSRRANVESLALSKAKNVDDIRTVEGRVAQQYWKAIQSIIPETFDFQSRIIRSHQYNASDPVNLCLNYAYGVLEGECRKAINTVGLEPSVGFLHEFSDYQSKQSLVYDLQEPYRWIGDLTTIEAFESGSLDMKDFYFMGDDYRYRIEVEAKKRFLGLLRDRFNSGVKYKGKTWKWDTVILNKTQELARFLVGKSSSIDFMEPTPSLVRHDAQAIRKRILELSMKEARELGISKSTLHGLRKHGRSDRSFKVYQKVVDRLGTRYQKTLFQKTISAALATVPSL